MQKGRSIGIQTDSRRRDRHRRHRCWFYLRYHFHHHLHHHHYRHPHRHCHRCRCNRAFEKRKWGRYKYGIARLRVRTTLAELRSAHCETYRLVLLLLLLLLLLLVVDYQLSTAFFSLFGGFLHV